MISRNNFSSYIFIYKLVFIKIKIKKVAIKPYHFYYNIYNFFYIIVYITILYKYIKDVCLILEYLFVVMVIILFFDCIFMMSF